jgi:hypothetical protein
LRDRSWPGVDFTLATTRMGFTVAGSIVDETGGLVRWLCRQADIRLGRTAGTTRQHRPHPSIATGRFEVNWRLVLSPGRTWSLSVQPSAKPGIPLAPPPPGALNRQTHSRREPLDRARCGRHRL